MDMKTRAVNSNDFFTGEDCKPRLRMGESAYGLEVGDQVTTASGAFKLIGRGYGYWNLAPVVAANVAIKKRIFNTPTTTENFDERCDFLSPADRLTAARELGLIG
jgi:hypothetical protein